MAIMAGVAMPVDAQNSDKVLQSAVDQCEDNAPDNPPPNGFAPFEDLSRPIATGQPNTYSRYRQLQPEYPGGVFASAVYGSRGLQYFATLSGGGAPNKQFAWTVMSVPRIVPPEQRNGAYALWDAIILEVERPFSNLIESAAGQEARKRFEDAKERSPVKILPYDRFMAGYSVATGTNPQGKVLDHWTSLLGKWMMNVILDGYPKRHASFDNKVAYDHIAYFHVLTDARFSTGSKYTFVSNTRLGTAGPPAFAFLINSSGKCIAAKSIKTVAGHNIK
jgi:hypothetical protein